MTFSILFTRMNVLVGSFFIAIPLQSILAQVPHADGGLVTNQRDAFDKPSLGNAPTPLDALIVRGKVRFEFYKKQRREFPGETHFSFTTTSTYRYTSQVRVKNGRRFAEVSVRISDVKVECENVIHLPVEIRDKDLWRNTLVIHEFEHVRLNADARPKQLAEFLMKGLRRVEVPLGNTELASDDAIKKAMDSHFASIREEIIRIMRANNVLLDKLTLHGMRKLEAPEDFFGKLYTRENLEEFDFAYLADVKKLLLSHDYSESP